MAKIFLSHSNEDEAFARTITALLEEVGLSVWWDDKIEGGARYSTVIEQELRDCDFIVVVWSEASLQSQWVADEAVYGRDHNKLVPIRIEDVEPPLGFRQLQAIDFSKWDNRPTSDPARRLLTALNERPEDTVDQSDYYVSEEILTSTFWSQLIKTTAGQRGRFAVSLLGFLAVLIAIVFLTKNVREQTTASEYSITRIAVLPLENLSRDASYDYLSDGFSEEILISLSKVNSLQVISRYSAFAIRDAAQDIEEVGAALNVNYMLVGTFRKEDEWVRVAVHLVDVELKHNVWSEIYEFEVNNVFETQGAISIKVLEALNITLNLDEETRVLEKGTSNLAAYDAYIKCRQNLNWESPEQSQRAINFCQKAIEHDENYADAWGGIALAYAFLHPFRSFEVISPQIDRASKRALRLNPDQPEALTARAYFVTLSQWDWKSANQLYKRAMKSPGFEKAAMLYTASHLIPLGKYEKAATIYQSAIGNDPLNIGLRWDFAGYSQAFGYGDEALYQWSRILEITELASIAKCGQATALYTVGRIDEAVGKLSTVTPKTDPWSLYFCGLAFHTVGNNDSFNATSQLLSEYARDDPSYGFAHAELSILSGNVTDSMNWFELAVERKSFGALFLRGHWIATPEFVADPRYDALLKKIRLDDTSLNLQGLTYGG
jgi:TolB-like protein